MASTACTSRDRVGIQASLRCSSISPVMTARTLGCASRRGGVHVTIRACASGLRRIAPYSIPGSCDVVDERAAAADEPGVLLAPERARRRCDPGGRSPVTPAAVGPGPVAGPPPAAAVPLGGLVLGGPLHRPDDVLVAGAPADLAGQRLADLPGGRVAGCGRAASGRSSSCPGCRTRTAARGTGEALLHRVERGRRMPRPSTVRTRCPSAMAASTVHDFTGVSSSQTTQAPQFEVSQPQCEPVSPRSSRRKWISSSRGSTSRVNAASLTVTVICTSGTLVPRRDAAARRSARTVSSAARCRL